VGSISSSCLGGMLCEELAKDGGTVTEIADNCIGFGACYFGAIGHDLGVIDEYRLDMEDAMQHATILNDDYLGISVGGDSLCESEDGCRASRGVLA